jgi:hypothetical protein
MFYFFLEYFRPADPLKMPLVISIVMFVWWATLKNKIWAPQIVCFYLLVAAIAVMGPFAVNNYSLWIGFQSMAVWLIFISVPIIHVADSLRKLRALIDTLIALHCYLAIHALLNNGFGPGGFVEDENDVALSINTILPLAFFSLLTAQTTRGKKVLYAAAIVTMVAGVVATNSRGGFLGLVVAIVACLLFSPRRKLGWTVGAVLLLSGLTVAPDSYWAEMATILVDAESDVGTGAHRKRMWEIAMSMFWSNPVFGVGLNNFQWNVGNYMSGELLEKEGRSYMGTVAHSVYFTILSETGAVGSLLVASIVYFSVKSIRRVFSGARKLLALTDLDARVRANLLETKGMAHGLSCGMIGYGVSGIFLTTFAYPHLWYVVALIVALAKVAEGLVLNSTEPKSSAAR